MEFSREFNILLPAIRLADEKCDGGLKACDHEHCSEDAVGIVQEAISFLLTSAKNCKGRKNDEERAKQQVVSCLMMLYLPDETNPFADLIPDVSGMFLLRLIECSGLEASFIEFLCQIKEEPTFTRMHTDLKQHIKCLLNTFNKQAVIPFLLRAIKPLLPCTKKGDRTSEIANTLKEGLKLHFKVETSSKYEENLVQLFHLARSLHLCIFDTEQKVVKDNVDSLLAELVCVHYNWEGPMPPLRPDSLCSEDVAFFMNLLCEKGAAWERLSKEYKKIPVSFMHSMSRNIGYNNPCDVVQMLTDLIALQVHDASLNFDSKSAQLVPSFKRIKGNMCDSLVDGTAGVFSNCDLLKNVGLILKGKGYDSSFLLRKLLGLQNKDIKSDPRWLNMIKENSHLLHTMEDLEILHSQCVSCGHDDNTRKMLLEILRKLFHKLTFQDKDKLIDFNLRTAQIDFQMNDFDGAVRLAFNRLALGSKDRALSEAAWLALGYPKQFLKFAVANAMKHPGQSKVITGLLQSLPSLCLTDDLLSAEVMLAMMQNLSDEEQKNLVKFITQLLSSGEESVLKVKEFVRMAILPLVSVEKVVSETGMSFSWIMEMVDSITVMGSKSYNPLLPCEGDVLPFLITLAEIVDYCDVFWADGINGPKLVEAKEKALNCFEKVTLASPPNLNEKEANWLENHVQNVSSATKFWLKSSLLSDCGDLTSAVAKICDPDCAAPERLRRLQDLLEFSMLRCSSEPFEADVLPDSLTIDYAELVLILSAILPQKLSKEWLRCMKLIDKLLEANKLEPDQHKGASTSLMKSNLLLDVTQVLATSLTQASYYSQMMNHVSRCYAVSVKEITKTDSRLSFQDLAAILSHVCLVLQLLPPSASDPVKVLALDILRMIQETVTHTKIEDCIKTTLEPVLNVLHHLREREDTHVVIKKLNMFIKLYS